MHKIEVVGTKLVFGFPETGHEFTREQFLAFSRLVMQLNARLLNFDQFRVRLTYEFMNLRRTANINKPENGAVVENVAQISKFVEAYFSQKRENGAVSRVIDMVYFQQLLPTVKAKGKTFHGPGSALLNTVYGEYLQALTAFIDYSRTGEVALLDRMIATLYRPAQTWRRARTLLPGYAQDPRRKFNPELTDYYAGFLSALSPEVKHGIYLYFASCQHFIATNKALDIGGGNEIDLSLLFSSSPNAEAAKGLGMVGTLYSIAESKVFGNAKEVAAQNTYDVLAFLVDQKMKVEKMKSNQKNA